MPAFAYSDPLNAPGFLQDPHGQAWFKATGSVRDYMLDRAKRGVRCRFPLSCPIDALPYLAQDRQIPVGDYWQTPAQLASNNKLLRTAIQQAFITKQTEGGVFTMLAELALYLDPSACVVVAQSNNGLVTQINNAAPNSKYLVASEGSWLPDVVSVWSKYSVLILHPFPATWIAGGMPGAWVQFPAVDTGTIVASGTPATDPGEIWITITGTGATGVATYSWASYQGANQLVAIQSGTGTTAAAATALGTTGVKVAFTGHFTNLDIYRWSLTPPAPGSSIANRFKSTLASLAPAKALLANVAVIQTGKPLGWGVGGDTTVTIDPTVDTQPGWPAHPPGTISGITPCMFGDTGPTLGGFSNTVW